MQDFFHQQYDLSLTTSGLGQLHSQKQPVFAAPGKVFEGLERPKVAEVVRQAPKMTKVRVQPFVQGVEGKWRVSISNLHVLFHHNSAYMSHELYWRCHNQKKYKEGLMNRQFGNWENEWTSTVLELTKTANIGHEFTSLSQSQS